MKSENSRKRVGRDAVCGVTRAIGASHTQFAKMCFDEIFDLTAGLYFFLNSIPGIYLYLCNICVCLYPICYSCTTLALPPSSITQIRVHIPVPAPPSPLRHVPSFFLARRCQQFIPSLTRAELYPPTLLGALSR